MTCITTKNLCGVLRIHVIIFTLIAIFIRKKNNNLIFQRCVCYASSQFTSNQVLTSLRLFDRGEIRIFIEKRRSYLAWAKSALKRRARDGSLYRKAHKTVAKEMCKKFIVSSDVTVCWRKWRRPTYTFWCTLKCRGWPAATRVKKRKKGLFIGIFPVRSRFHRK